MLLDIGWFVLILKALYFLSLKYKKRLLLRCTNLSLKALLMDK